MKYIQIIDGPNLNLTGKRQPELYGEQPISEAVEEIKRQFQEADVLYYQSNIEGELIDRLHSCGYDENCLGIILNGGAYTHTSLALSDAVAAIPATVIEVHITNIHKRGRARSRSLLSSVCKGTISGFGLDSYKLAAKALLMDANIQ